MKLRWTMDGTRALAPWLHGRVRTGDRRIRLCVCAVLGLGLLGGCRIAQRRVPTRAVPVLDVTWEVGSGSVLSGPRPLDVNTLRIEEATRVTARFFALERIPADVLDPLYQRIRLVMTSPRPNVLSPVMRLTPGARAAFDDRALRATAALAAGTWGRVLPVAETTAMLPAGATVMLNLGATAAAGSPGPRLRILLARCREADPNATLEVGLVRTGRLPASTAPLIGAAPAVRDANTLETVTERAVLLPLPLTDPLPGLLLLPFTWESPWARGIAVSLTLETLGERVPEAEDQAAFAHCVKSLMAERVRLAALDETPGPWAGCRLAVEQLARPVHWRRALVYLTEAVGAELAADLALAAPPSLARQLAGRVYDLQAERPAQDLDELAWQLERSAYELLLEAADQDALGPALAELLLRHAGQMGRQLPTLRERVAAAQSRTALQRSLIEENLISLEDMSPAARARAYAWLEDRGQAPPGYDPLAPVAQRRAVLQDQQEGRTRD